MTVLATGLLGHLTTRPTGQEGPVLLKVDALKA
jgi:hypothetical protein